LEKGLQWETTWLDLPNGEHKKPEYLAINPVGKVPALIDDGVIVHDSTIINEYLEDKFPEKPLLPRDPAMKARARAFEDYCDAYFAPSLGKILMQMRKPGGSATASGSKKANAKCGNTWSISSANSRDASSLRGS
jgi:glutathione S-transferase